MGVTSIDDVLKYVSDNELEKCLTKCKDEHDKLDGDYLIESFNAFFSSVRELSFAQ